MNRSKTSRQKGRVRVTDHAVVRYLERVEKRDLKQIQNAILTPTLLQWIEDMGGTGTYPTGDGCMVTVKNYVIVTVWRK